jgi:hypothetical protein
MTRLCLIGVILLLAGYEPATAQGSAGSNSTLEPRYVVDMPSAGMLESGQMGIDADFYQEGGMLFAFSYGIFDRLSVGLSYGGSGLIGSGTPVMNDVPGAMIKVRILDESVILPALAVGFDSQGRDGYLKALDRYSIKSPGFYAAVSKNYSMLGYLSLHAGVNYTLERGDGDRDVNGYLGVEKTIGPFVSLTVEYNVGLNDNSSSAIGRGRGYLNSALDISVGGGLTIGVHLKDLTGNARNVKIANRTFRLEFAHPL